MQPDPPPGGRSGAPARPQAEPARVPAAPPTDGRWRFNTTPSWARGLLYSFPLLPFSEAKKSIESPRGLHAPSPVCMFLFHPFAPCVSPPPWGSETPGADLPAPGSARSISPAPPQAGAGVTVSGVWPRPGPRVQSGHFRCCCELGPGATSFSTTPPRRHLSPSLILSQAPPRGSRSPSPALLCLLVPSPFPVASALPSSLLQKSSKELARFWVIRLLGEQHK